MCQAKARRQGPRSRSSPALHRRLCPRTSAAPQASLERSLESLGLATVDLFYIHNPAESQLRQLGRAAFMQVAAERRGCGCSWGLGAGKGHELLGP